MISSLAILAQIAIAPCTAITGVDSVRADRCIEVVEDTVIPPPVVSDSFSHAYDRWVPASGECTRAQHNTYRAKGPDGKWYPIWHPPVDPSGCSYGHEHGRDPTEALATSDTILFGWGNERLAEFEGQLPRHEDHVGHKIEWANGLDFIPSKAGTLARKCDVLIKLHQGTHSADAFTNNVHEFRYDLKCTDNAEMHFIMMAPIGTGGSFAQTCTGTTVIINVGVPPNPPDSPGGTDTRQIPTRTCVDNALVGLKPQGVQYSKAFGEVWPVSVQILRPDGNRIAQVAIYANLADASRYYDPTKPNNLGKSVDVCYETDNPSDGRTQAECRTVRSFLPDTLTQYDPRSPFKGVRRSVRWNQIGLTNNGRPTTYYTDPFGRRAQATPFTGSIKQTFSSTSNDGMNVYAPTAVGNNYNGVGVRAN